MTDGRAEKGMVRDQLDSRLSATGRDSDNARVVAMMWQYATPGKQWEIITNENR